MLCNRSIVNNAIMLLGIVNLLIAAHAGEFVKNGNNGTVSCDIFCGAAIGDSPVWGGQIGYCKSAVNEDTKKSTSCNSVPGLLSPKQLTCFCESENAFIKHGNNGTVSCDTFCQGSRWGGGIGTCVAAWDTKADANVSCQDTAGPFLKGPNELTCTCRRPESW